MLSMIMNVHLIWGVLLVFTLIMIFVGGLVSFLEPYLPQFVSEAFRYGKTVKSQKTSAFFVRAIELRKSRFLDFYIFASILTSFLLYHLIQVYIVETPAPDWLIFGLNLSCTDYRTANTTAESVSLAMILLTLQCFRRLFECLFINVDSGSKMNILHYIVGFVHYYCAGLGILCEAPGFVPPKPLRADSNAIHWLHVVPKIQDIVWYQWLSALVFVWAWFHQLSAHKIFAKLKKESGGRHAIPKGDWFNYVSCPHYLAEVMMYLCLAVILGPRHLTGIVVFMWVLINQVVAAMMSHYWYKEKFEYYPKKRKAIIPFIF